MVNIRLAHDQDIEALAILSTQLGYPCTAEDCQKFLGEIQPDPDHAVLIAESDQEESIGYIHVFKTKRLFINPFAELGALVVLEDFRGNGLGKLLLKKAEDWAREHGCREMRVRSNVVRERAHPFYLDQGYVVNKHQKIFTKKITDKT